MIDARPREARHVAPTERRGHWWLALFGILAMLTGGGVLYAGQQRWATPPAAAPATATPAPSEPPRAVRLAPAAPKPSDKPENDLGAVLKLPGRVPTRGDGEFRYAEGRGEVHGRSGSLRKYRVAVEKGSDEDVDAFAEQVDATLGDERSWTGGGRLRLQRVGGSDDHDFTVYLATRDTAGAMCLRGGVNITVGGRPYTSCRSTGKAIINLDRWRLSAPTYLSTRTPLKVYRHYVVNHEVGHELGHSHQGCPRSGGPAPVMVQQTLTLRGCKPYAWPRRDDRDLSGPGL